MSSSKISASLPLPTIHALRELIVRFLEGCRPSLGNESAKVLKTMEPLLEVMLDEMLKLRAIGRLTAADHQKLDDSLHACLAIARRVAERSSNA